MQKKMRRFLTAFLSIAVLLLNLIGCKRIATENGNESNRISIVDLAEYTIVYSEHSANTAEKELAVGLRDNLCERYGYSLPMATDRDVDGSGKVILVGSTACAPSVAALESLTREDWMVACAMDAVVIIGGCAVALEKAIVYFLAEGIAEDGTLRPLQHTEHHRYEFAETALSMASLNLRTARSAQQNNQSLREPRIADFVRTTKPDSIGMQECTAFWRTRLDEVLGEVGYKRAQLTHPNGEAMKNYIWYNPDTVKVVDSGYFWLSETPTFASRGFGSDYYISASWAIFENCETGGQYVHINTHLDAYHEDIRIKETTVLLSYINSFCSKGLPVFVTGDFNSTPDSPVIMALREVLTDCRAVAGKSTSTHTYNAYANDETAVYRSRKTIDYIQFAGAIVTVDVFGVTEKQNGGWLSDHNALTVIATICKR